MRNDKTFIFSNGLTLLSSEWVIVSFAIKEEMPFNLKTWIASKVDYFMLSSPSSAMNLSRVLLKPLNFRGVKTIYLRLLINNLEVSIAKTLTFI